MSMSRKEAERVLGNLKLYHDDDNEIWEALNMAVEALKEEKICPVYSDNEVKQPCVNCLECDLERPHGEWKKDGFFAICSECGHELQHYELVVSWLNFCPNCGADMRKEGEQKCGE